MTTTNPTKAQMVDLYIKRCNEAGIRVFNKKQILRASKEEIAINLDAIFEGKNWKDMF